MTITKINNNMTITNKDAIPINDLGLAMITIFDIENETEIKIFSLSAIIVLNFIFKVQLFLDIINKNVQYHIWHQNCDIIILMIWLLLSSITKIL